MGARKQHRHEYLCHGMLLFFLTSGTLLAQAPCDRTPAYSPCEFVFELAAAETAAHPNPYVSVELQAEFRSPRFRTFLMPAFWLGGNKMVIRFTPTEAGPWTYKITSNLASLDGKQGTFNAAESNSPGFVKVANVHHWATDNNKPHLWMGYIVDRLGFMPESEFTQSLSTAAGNQFNHIRGSILGDTSDGSRVLPAPDMPNAAYFEQLDQRLLQIHRRGFTADLILAANPEHLTKLLPDWQGRERFLRYLIARYACLNITWQGLGEFEDYSNGRELLKEMGLALKKLDPYQHPRSTNAKVTSSPLLADGWMNFIIEASSDDQIGSVEHQFYPVPFVGITDAQHLWNATMDGEYPEFRPGNEKIAGYWFKFMSDTRHWELEPYFDLDGGRAVALEDAEYVVYVEKPGPPVEVSVEKHGYDVSWFNPLTGETVGEKKYKGEHFTGQAPDNSHPWVLSVAREGHLDSMLRSYKFESRIVPVQEIEQNTPKVPFEVADPTGDTVVYGKPARYSTKLKRETRATRSMVYLWTGEVPAEGQGFRVLGTGGQGTFTIPAVLASRYPSVISIRVSALNANGKAYSIDKVYQLTK